MIDIKLIRENKDLVKENIKMVRNMMYGNFGMIMDNWKLE